MPGPGLAARAAGRIARAWQRIRAGVRDWNDLEPALIGRVEELIDFVTAPAVEGSRGKQEACPTVCSTSPASPTSTDRGWARRSVCAAGRTDAPGDPRRGRRAGPSAAPGSPLRRLVEGSGAASVILYGPPGTGKTTLASLISRATGRRFEALSALSAGVKEVRAVIESARERAAVHGEQTVLFIDEVHRFSKTQQDALLSAVENRVVLLVAATTENPSFSVVAPLLSRSLILQLQPLTADDIRAVVRRAIDDPRGLGGQVEVADDAVDLLVQLSAGDARRALTALEVAAEAGDEVTVETIEQSLDKAAVRYDRDGDQHYDVISAFIKSIRGSDVDAALHYLARMLVAGEDPRFVARRLMILASEDIGMADPTALQTAVAAAQTVQLIGMPEAQLTLAHATVHLATAPKSNAVTTALGAAMGDIREGKAGLVPTASARRPLLGGGQAGQRGGLRVLAR